MSSRFGPLDLKTKTGRHILRMDWRTKKYWKWNFVETIKQTLSQINIRFGHSNYYNILNKEHWRLIAKYVENGER